LFSRLTHYHPFFGSFSASFAGVFPPLLREFFVPPTRVITKHRTKIPAIGAFILMIWRKHVKNIKIGIKGRVTVFFVVMGLLLSFCVGYAVYTSSSTQVREQYTNLAFGVARTSAAFVNGDSVNGFLNYGVNDEYHNIYHSLKDLKDFFDLMYLYVVAPDPVDGQIVYVFDVFSGTGDPSLFYNLGDRFAQTAAHAVITDVYKNAMEISIVSDNEYGWVVSAYVPVFGGDGRVSAIVGADISMDRVMSDIVQSTIRTLVVTIGIILLSLYILLLLIGRKILRPVVMLSRFMGGFTSGNMQPIEVKHTGDELQTMSESFNSMINEIKLYMENLATVTADRERIATELSVATQIQASMLPCIFPAFPERNEFELYASMIPAKEVGGDFYDFFMVDDTTLAVVIADVSGKGVPAALFMVIAKTLIKNTAQQGKNPKEVFETVNAILCENNEAELFVTAFIGYLDIVTGRFSFVNAGHNPPLLKQNGRYEWLKQKSGFVLAMMDDMKYKQYELTLIPGDELFLYTDGVTEATGANEELYGDDRLYTAMQRFNGYPPYHLVQSMNQEISRFEDGREQADDITMLIMRFDGK
jgi:sigma-B regulation protein RsbU (phosphoserine phosphatase)